MLERSSKIHSNCKKKRKIPEINSRYNFRFYLQQQAALMAAATAQGTYINPMAALAHVGAGQLPHALNGMPNPVVPPTSGTSFVLLFLFPLTTINLDISYSFTSPEYRVNETVLSRECIVRGLKKNRNGNYVSAKILKRKKKERSEYIGEIIRNKWDTRRKRTVPAPLCTLCCEISQSHRGETSFFTSPPSPPPHLFLFSRIPRPRHSPLPYNRLINQYNIFTERDSSERYCRCRETLSKASPGRRGKEEKPEAPFLPFFLPLSGSSHSREEGKTKRRT